MKLKNLFSFNTTILVDALRNNDAAALESLRNKKEDWFATYLNDMSLARITPAMADIFVNKFTDKNWQRWGYRENSRNIVLNMMMTEAAVAGRTDLLDIYFKGGLTFNEGKAGTHIIHYLLKGSLTDEAKALWVKKILDGGLDKVDGAQSLVAEAAERGCGAAFDLLAQATGADIHKNNEELLRAAAQAGQREMCRHLVENHAAALDSAITTSRTLGQQDVWKFLEGLRAELRPGESAPPTIESLSEEVKALKAAVRELTARARAQDAERALDKPALFVPGKAAAGMKTP